MLWTLVIIAALLVLLIGLWLLHRFFAKASLETALVRTGLGGRRVIIDGGCFALPILHRLQPVSMQASVVHVVRTGQEAALTQDQLRADIKMEFEYRVSPTEEGIATAAQALGKRIARNGDAISELLSGQLLDAIQATAANHPLDAIHLNRASFSAEVAEALEKRAAQLGLMLVSASLISVDQSNLTQLDEKNAFNAKGMRRLAELVAEEQKARVEIETKAETAIREHRQIQHQRRLELERAEREAEIEQEEYLSRLKAESEARAEQAQATAKSASDSTRIEQERQVKAAQVSNDESLRMAEMEAVRSLEEAKIANDIKLARKRAEESQAKAEEEEAEHRYCWRPRLFRHKRTAQ